MTISRKSAITFVILALLSLAAWVAWTYPTFSFIDLSVSKSKALKIAHHFLAEEREVDLSPYQHAIVFAGARNEDQYLQKALGFDNEMEFFRVHDFELFFWQVRFFQENSKEEYFISVSAGTGEITGFSHIIDDSDARADQTAQKAKEKAIGFLKQRFAFDPDQHILHNDQTYKLDNRIDYSFSWEKKGVYIPWSREENTGGAKLLIGATVSGEEILSFTKTKLQIPDQFNRYMDRLRSIGGNLALIFRLLFLSLLTASIFYVVVRRNDLVMQSTKNLCLTLTFVLFAFYILTHLNSYESIIYHYPTTKSWPSYLWQYILGNLMSTFIVTISILMPCLAGESLHFEVFPNKKSGSFLHYIQSTVWSRNVFHAIILGYLVAIIMFGIQTIAFEIGRNYFGVWIEYTWMTQLSGSYIPFLAALVLGYSASFTEEIAFRLFSISLGKKILKRTLPAVILASIFWGYGHSTYPVYPMWFRGLEVTCLGLFLSFIYLRYGIIPVLIAHFLFDVFWSSSAYLLGKSTSYQFFSALVVLLLPLAFGLIAYLKNQPETERPLRWRLSKHQVFNLGILKNYLQGRRLLDGKNDEQIDQLKSEITSHGWDLAVVDLAIDDLRNNSSSQQN